MLTEDYVSYEIAKLLKEKGFIIPYDSFRGVYVNGKFKRLNPGSGYGYNPEDEVIAVCSLQLAMKWLREEHKIFIQVELYSKYGDYYFDLFQSTYRVVLKKFVVYNTYEQAVEAAIKYCLENLI